MNKVIVVLVYFCISILFAQWMDTMDREYVIPEKQSPMLMSLLMGALWPMSLPLAMWSLTEKGHRWTAAR